VRVLSFLAVLLATSLAAASGRAQEASRCTDEGLTQLALRHALDGTSADALLTSARTEGHAQYPSLHLVRLPADDDAARDAWLADLERRGLTPLACGEARNEHHVVFAAAPNQGALQLTPEGVRVTLTEGFTEPVVYVRSGHAEPIAIEVREGLAEIPFEAMATPLVLQLVATNPRGPRPIAELVIGGTRTEEALPTNATLIDVLRARHERGALRPNRMLVRAAQAHAEQSCRAQQVAHVIDEHGDAEARLRSDHIAARHVGEVVARAEDESAAWRTLAESPSHRLAIGDARFTDVGIGRAEAHGRTCLVVVLAAWPRYVASTR
jgi:uncharacterized protein YkwD